MNSLTHGGIEQVARRNTGKTVFPNYTDEEVIGTAQITGELAIKSFQQIAMDSNKKELVKEAFLMWAERKRASAATVAINTDESGAGAAKESA